MDKFFYKFFIALCSVLFLSSCSEDEEEVVHDADIPQVVLQTFISKYPTIIPEWENVSGYYVAEFWLETMETHVWITAQGEWVMTEMDLGTQLTLLPQTVRDAFKSGQYATWEIEDLDKYERPDRIFYQIEVEMEGQPDHNLYYAPDGTLIKDEVDKENNDITPNTPI